MSLNLTSVGVSSAERFVNRGKPQKIMGKSRSNTPVLKTFVVKKLSSVEFDVECPDTHQDGHVRFEKGAWFMDIFDSSIKDADRAHIQTVEISRGKSQPDWPSVFELIS